MSFIRPIIAAASLAVIAAPANAAEIREYNAAAFMAAQAAGRPILLDVAAWWCPVCMSQNGTIKKIVASADYAKLVVFKINYDKQQAEWRSFGVTKQGTLIAYRGKQEVGRLAFQTDKAQIGALLASTIR